MMMIMHEPDKKKRRKWLAESLLHFSEPEDWKKKRKKGYFCSGKRAGWLLDVSRTAQCFLMRWDSAAEALPLPHAVADTH